MANCIVLECWNSLVDQRMHYTALSDLFEPALSGELVPEYLWVIADDLSMVECHPTGKETVAEHVKLVSP